MFRYQFWEEKQRKREEKREKNAQKRTANAGEWTGFKQPLPDPSTDTSLTKVLSITFKASLADRVSSYLKVPGTDPLRPPKTLDEAAQCFYSTHHYLTNLPQRFSHWSYGDNSQYKPIVIQPPFNVPMQHPDAPQGRYLRATVWRKNGSVLDSGLDVEDTTTTEQIMAGVRGLLGLPQDPTAGEREKGPLLLLGYSTRRSARPDVSDWMTEASLAEATEAARIKEEKKRAQALAAADPGEPPLAEGPKPAASNPFLVNSGIRNEYNRILVLELPRVPSRGTERVVPPPQPAAPVPLPGQASPAPYRKDVTGVCSIPTYVRIRFVKDEKWRRYCSAYESDFMVVLTLEPGEELGGPAAAEAIKERLRAFLNPLAKAQRVRATELKRLEREARTEGGGPQGAEGAGGAAKGAAPAVAGPEDPEAASGEEGEAAVGRHDAMMGSDDEGVKEKDGEGSEDEGMGEEGGGPVPGSPPGVGAVQPVTEADLARLLASELQYGPVRFLGPELDCVREVDPAGFKNGAGRIKTYAEDGPRERFDAGGLIVRHVRPEDYPPDPEPLSDAEEAVDETAPRKAPTYDEEEAKLVKAAAGGGYDARMALQHLRAYGRHGYVRYKPRLNQVQQARERRRLAKEQRASARRAKEESIKAYAERRVFRADAVASIQRVSAYVSTSDARREKSGASCLMLALVVKSEDIGILDRLHETLGEPLGTSQWSKDKFEETLGNIKLCEEHKEELAIINAKPVKAITSLLAYVKVDDPRGAPPAPAAAGGAAAAAGAADGGGDMDGEPGDGAGAAAAAAEAEAEPKAKGKQGKKGKRQEDLIRVKMTITESEGNPRKGTLTLDVFGRRDVGLNLLPGCGGLVMFQKSRFDVPPAKAFFDMYLEGSPSAESERAREVLKSGPNGKTKRENAEAPMSLPALLQSLEASEDRPQAEQPDGLTVTMRSYQRQSLQFMLDQEARDGGYRDVFWSQVEDPVVQGRRFWYSPFFGAVADSVPPQHRGGFLADEMGLGKTVVTLALALSDREAASREATPGPEGNGDTGDAGDAAAAAATAGLPTTASVRSRATLVVCAVSLVGQWIDEARAKLDLEDLEIYQYHGTNRKRDLAFLADHDLIVTTYQTLSSDWSAAQKAKKESDKPKQNPLGAICWHRIILDESHYVKSPTIAQTKACVALESPRRWCVSGTPVGTDLGDLLGQFQFLRMAPLSQKDFFDVNFKEAFRGTGGMSRAFLTHVLQESMVRHSKKVLELPPKHTELVPVSLGTKEQAKYLEVQKVAKEQFLKCRALGPLAVNSNILAVMALTNPLRRICSGGNLTSQELHVSDLMARLEKQAGRALLQQAAAAGGGDGGGDGSDVVVPEDVADECSICLDEMERPLKTPCNHFFCGECIRGFLEQGSNRGCPLCRTKLAIGQLRKAMTQREFELDAARKKASEERARRIAEGQAVDEEEEEGEEGPEGSLAATSKLKVLLRELRAMRATDPKAKALVFSQYTSTVEWLKKRLTAEGFGYRFINGSMPLNQRTKAIDAFQGDPPTTVFLLTMRTGAVGINLTAADHVFLLEPAMNPALEEQAIGRAWRMGQQRQVVVKRLYCKGTIEETILKLSDEKRSTTGAAEEANDNWDRRRRRQQQRARTQAVAGNLRQDHGELRAQEIELLFSDPRLEDEPEGQEEAAMERARELAKTRGLDKEAAPDPEPEEGAAAAAAAAAAAPGAGDGAAAAAAGNVAPAPAKMVAVRKKKGSKAAKVEVEEAPAAEVEGGGAGGRRPRRAAAAKRPVYRVDDEEEENEEEIEVVVVESEEEEEEGRGKKNVGRKRGPQAPQAKGGRGGGRGRGGRGARGGPREVTDSDSDKDFVAKDGEEDESDGGSIEVMGE